ncbi:PilX N-terminal domain-containing pilus assembly protein [Desulfatibacillum aliphaticivorans]|uniref:PilX N-terminal domain-containing pilus assembly protein n=1 Tax=Desulfatibacillum aliphaticivorans TaxID=218208 RepID=UPI0009FCC476|nr:PilX N-terminal domain-containing pilus assembly protein [Desulfatibacillum aliphaticivorans]
MNSRMLKKAVSSENGSILILALLVMVVLSLLGVTAMTSSSTDIAVAKNQDVYNRNFALAEAAARLGALQVKSAKYAPRPDDDALGDTGFTDDEMPAWMYKGSPFPDRIKDPLTWTTGIAEIALMGEVVKFKVRYDGKSDGNIDDTGDDFTEWHRYTIFGRSNNDSGEVIVQMGYQLELVQSDVDRQTN